MNMELRKFVMAVSLLFVGVTVTVFVATKSNKIGLIFLAIFWALVYLYNGYRLAKLRSQ
jgi:hypothetical protein